jgi:hypothetical protein
MDLFTEEDARDELGIGAIRDALSDMMFPGTSTIQTRLRYMLFVPWIYLSAARLPGSAATRADFARSCEIELIGALEAGGEQVGVIGSVARAALKRLPSDVYWAGLGVLGIRRFQGSRNACLEPGSGEEEAARLWAPGLPDQGTDFLEKTSFHLRRDEADFITDRLHAAAPDSLFRELVRSGKVAECPAIWTHPLRADWSPENRIIVDHAWRFSVLMHGAALLYNLMLAELSASGAAEGSSWHGRVEDYRARLTGWRGEMQGLALSGWRLDDLWHRAETTPHRVAPATRRFVTAWLEAALSCGGEVADATAARQIVERRETRLKGAKSRFRNAAALARWGGASGTAPLNYRWPIVASHLKDLANAL